MEGFGIRADVKLLKSRRSGREQVITLLERKDVPYAGLDVHRDTINQAAVLDGDGRILTNQKVPHMSESVRDMAGRLPKQTRYVMKSSSVWTRTYQHGDGGDET